MAEPSDNRPPLHYPVYTSPLGDKALKVQTMVELKIYLSEGVNERFRKTAMNVYGYGRGSLSKAAEEALIEWCTRHDEQTPRSNMSATAESGKNPTEANGSRIDPDERQRSNSNSSAVAQDNSSQPLQSGH